MEHLDKKQMNILINKVMEFIAQVHHDSFLIMPHWLNDIHRQLTTSKEDNKECTVLFSKLKNALRNEYGLSVMNKLIGVR